MMSNPIILAVDTTTGHCGLALSRGEELVCSMIFNTGRPHSQSLFPAISSLCDVGGVNLSEVDYFSAVSGPGSFTGLRVGLSAILGLADSLGKSTIGKDALSLLAQSAGEAGRFFVAANAGRAQLFCGLREVQSSRNVSNPAEDVSAKPVLIKDIFFAQTPPTAVVLDATELSTDQDRAVDEFLKAQQPLKLYRVHRKSLNLAVLLAIDVARNLANNVQPPLAPYYIRPSDAQLKSSVD